MKKVFLLPVLAICAGWMSISTASAQSQQETLQVTVPYEFTNLDPRITQMEIECRIYQRSNQNVYGRESAIVDITPPNDSGSVVMVVQKDRREGIGGNMPLYASSYNYNCTTLVFANSENGEALVSQHFREANRGHFFDTLQGNGTTNGRIGE